MLVNKQSNQWGCEVSDKPLKGIKIPKENRNKLSDFAKKRMIYMRSYRIKQILMELKQ